MKKENKIIALFLSFMLYHIVCSAHWDGFYFRQIDNSPKLENISDDQIHEFQDLLQDLIYTHHKTSNSSEENIKLTLENDREFRIIIDIPIGYYGIYKYHEFGSFLGNEFDIIDIEWENKKQNGEIPYVISHKGFQIENGFLPKQDFHNNSDLVQYFPSDSLNMLVSRKFINKYRAIEEILTDVTSQYDEIMRNSGKKYNISPTQIDLIKRITDSLPYEERVKIIKDLNKNKINKKVRDLIEPMNVLSLYCLELIREKVNVINQCEGQGKNIAEIGEMIFNLHNIPQFTITHHRPGYGNTFDPSKYPNWKDTFKYPSEIIADTILLKKHYQSGTAIFEKLPSIKLNLSQDYIDYSFMMIGWEWCTPEYPNFYSGLKENAILKNETFPYKISYYQYPSYPQYRFIVDERGDKTPYVFDDKGNLIRVLYHKTEYNIIPEEVQEGLRRALYDSNFLNIQSYGDEINTKIKYKLGLFLSDEEKIYIYNGPKEELYASKGTPNDPFYNWFIKVDEFIESLSRFTTERIDDVTFRNVYEDKNGNFILEVIVKYSAEAPYRMAYYKNIDYKIYRDSKSFVSNLETKDIYAKILLQDGRILHLKTDSSIQVLLPNDEFEAWNLDAYWEEGEDESIVIFTGEGTSYLSILGDYIYEGYYHDGQCWIEEWVGGEEGSDEGGLEDVGYYPKPSNGKKLVSIRFYK